MSDDDKKLIVALDFATARKALQLVDQLDSNRCRLKVGKELFTSEGPVIVEKLQNKGFEIFLDLKFHDIPNTTAAACAAAAELGVWMVNVHALGGRRMMEAARDAIDRADKNTILIGVTILTSMETADLEEIGLSGKPGDEVDRLASLANSSGLDGLVCSAHEVERMRACFGDDFILVTPGIRPAGANVGDQKRIMTPKEALGAGSSYLVIGRPVTQASIPAEAFEEIYKDIC